MNMARKLSPLDRLRKMERTGYQQWSASVRRVQERRNHMLLSEGQEYLEKKALLAMAIIEADSNFRLWSMTCETLDELELGETRENERP